MDEAFIFPYMFEKLFIEFITFCYDYESTLPGSGANLYMVPKVVIYFFMYPGPYFPASLPNFYLLLIY